MNLNGRIFKESRMCIIYYGQIGWLMVNFGNSVIGNETNIGHSMQIITKFTFFLSSKRLTEIKKNILYLLCRKICIFDFVNYLFFAVSLIEIASKISSFHFS